MLDPAEHDEVVLQTGHVIEVEKFQAKQIQSNGNQVSKLRDSRALACY